MKLKEIAKVQGGYAFKSDSFVSNETPIIRIGNIVNNKVIIDNDITAPISTIGDRKEFLIFKDDLLIAMSGATVGKVGIYSFDNPSMLNQRVGNIKCDEKYKKYVFYLLQSPQFKKYVELSSIGCAQPNISNSQIENFEFKENSIGEIENIVRKLDNVSSLINIKKNEIEKLNILVKSQFVEMFGTIKNNNKFAYITIGEVIDKNIIKIKKRFKNGDKIKYIDISSIDSAKNVMSGYTDYKVGEEPSRAQQCLRYNDIVVSTVRPNLKNIAMNKYNDDNIIGTSGFCVLRSKGIRAEYLMYILLSDDFTNDMSSITTGANYPAIHNEDIYNYKIPNAPLELQNKFSEFVKQVDKQKFNKVLNSLKYTEYMLKYKC